MNTPAVRSQSTTLRRVLVRAIAGSFLFAAVFTAFGAFGTFSDEADPGASELSGWLIGLAAIVVAAAVVWMVGKGGTVAGNIQGAANRGLGFGIVALVSIPVFWLGVYAVFAAGSFVLGGAALKERGGSTRAKAIAGIVLAALGTVAGAAANMFG
ncbi:MAG: hypothetical protein HY875_02505 [Chloroflexi bacterium]|nr:hypothetical protein [Chloroflexota bacterium]